MIEIYNKFDDKISHTLTVSITLLTLNFGIGYFLLDKKFNIFSCILLAISIIFYSISIYKGVENHTSMDISYLDPLTFYNQNYQLDAPDFEETASVTIAQTIQTIRILNNEKAERFKQMIDYMLYGIIIMAFAFVSLLIFI